MINYPIMQQTFGQNWANYNGDCVHVMKGLPDNSVDFSVFSPPFLALYIYSDSVADLGNTDSEKQFFDGWLFHLEELYRILKPGQSIAIHCKDTMRYKSSHDYAGLYDFPGQIIRCAGRAGFLYQRWITVWKDPVIEMQRKKTNGLLHKSFKTRAEVTRQGAADFVLIFSKPGESPVPPLLINDRKTIPSYRIPLLESAIERIKHQWSIKGERVQIDNLQSNMALSIWSKSMDNGTSEFYTSYFIQELSDNTQPGRLTVIHCQDIEKEEYKYSMQSEIVKRFEAQGSWKFHSRIALTDGTSLVVFRNWTKEHKKHYKDFAGAVTHNLQAPAFNGYETVIEYFVDDNFWTSHVSPYMDKKEFDNLDTRQVTVATYTGDTHPDYIGKNPPVHWRDDTYYSILVWQRYASPVWFDLDGLPETHKDCWMTINQTNVLNVGLKSEKEQRHICPLQLDLIELLVKEYSEPGQTIFTPYGGIGSEGVKALELDRKAILSELKTNYWELANLQLQKIELKKAQISMWGDSP